MRAFIQAFQGKPWNDDCETAYRGFRKLGIECVLFSTTDDLDCYRLAEDVVVGGMLIMEHVLAGMNLTLPNYNYPDELQKYLGREIRIIELSELKNEILPVFIKPVEEKIAKGCVVKSWNDLSEYDSMAPDTEIICSDVINFVSEWRCFVRYGEVLGVCFYNGDRNVKCDLAIIEEAVRKYTEKPAAFVLDFGVAEDGRTLLVEMNEGMAVGCYGLEDEDYAKFLLARWMEIVGEPDPLDAGVRRGYVEPFFQRSNEKELIECMLDWKLSDDAYIIELRKRVDLEESYNLRLYEDGNGVIVYVGKDRYATYYFQIKDHLRNKITERVSKKTESILASPVQSFEDDRCWEPVHLRYNIRRVCPDAYDRLLKHMTYEDVEYGWDENKIKIAKLLLSAPEIKRRWMKMHSEFFYLTVGE